MSSDVRSYATLTIALHRQGPVVWVELSFADPTSQAEVAPRRGPMALDLAALRASQLEPESYGRLLAAQTFEDTEVRARFLQAEVATQARGRPLRISIRVDPSAQELQGLRWELLRHPVTGARLATSEHVIFSRFMVSTDWRPIRVRGRSELRAVVAISAPPREALARAGLAEVDLDAEVARARSALSGMAPAVIGGPDRPCTLDAVVEAARGGADVLYIVSHGSFARSTGMPTLFFQDQDGGLVITKGEDLAARLGELASGPRLVVLLSCQSAGDGADVDPEQRATVQTTLAVRLADAGVPAVLAMQGNVSMETAAALMPVFFTELLQDGQVDRALAVARAGGAVRDRPDHWMPVLFLRLTNGRLWYTPDFASDSSEDIWDKLVPLVRKGALVPILGPGMLEPLGCPTFDVARRIAEDVGFPLATHEWDDLPRVMQFLAVKRSWTNAVIAYEDQVKGDVLRAHGAALKDATLARRPLLAVIREAAAHLRRTDPDDPWRALASLPAAVYVSTNFEPVLTAALTEAGKRPTQMCGRWRHEARIAPEPDMPVKESVAAPLVFHTFGLLGADTARSLVLTEDDYFDYLMTSASTPDLMPAPVNAALSTKVMVFLGFRLTDWSFRVLFRSIMRLEGMGATGDHCHVAVQVDPELETMPDIQRAKAYLKLYFGKAANIDIYWGTPREFLAELGRRLGPVESWELADSGE